MSEVRKTPNVSFTPQCTAPVVTSANVSTKASCGSGRGQKIGEGFAGPNVEKGLQARPRRKEKPQPAEGRQAMIPRNRSGGRPTGKSGVGNERKHGEEQVPGKKLDQRGSADSHRGGSPRKDKVSDEVSPRDESLNNSVLERTNHGNRKSKKESPGKAGAERNQVVCGWMMPMKNPRRQDSSTVGCWVPIAEASSARKMLPTKELPRGVSCRPPTLGVESMGVGEAGHGSRSTHHYTKKSQEAKREKRNSISVVDAKASPSRCKSVREADQAMDVSSEHNVSLSAAERVDGLNRAVVSEVVLDVVQSSLCIASSFGSSGVESDASEKTTLVTESDRISCVAVGVQNRMEDAGDVEFYERQTVVGAGNDSKILHGQDEMLPRILQKMRDTHKEQQPTEEDEGPGVFHDGSDTSSTDLIHDHDINGEIADKDRGELQSTDLESGVVEKPLPREQDEAGDDESRRSQKVRDRHAYMMVYRRVLPVRGNTRH